MARRSRLSLARARARRTHVVQRSGEPALRRRTPPRGHSAWDEFDLSSKRALETPLRAPGIRARIPRIDRAQLENTAPRRAGAARAALARRAPSNQRPLLQRGREAGVDRD